MNEQTSSSIETINDSTEQSEEIKQLKSNIYQLEEYKYNLIRQLKYLTTVLTSFNLETSTKVHQLYINGIITNEIVYRIMNFVDLSLFDDTSVNSSIETHGKLLSLLQPYVNLGSKILILVNSFSGFYFVALALMTGNELNSFNDEKKSSMSHYDHDGCVIGKVTRQDLKVIKDKYEHLLTTGRIKLNAFPEFTGSSVMSKGYPKSGPYDLILVPEIGWSNNLSPQLKTNGVVVNPFTPTDIMKKDRSGRLITL